jgi:hypothetical protein
MEVSQRIKARTTYESITPLQGIYSEEWKSGAQKDIYTTMSIVALFIIAKRCK